MRLYRMLEAIDVVPGARSWLACRASRSAAARGSSPAATSPWQLQMPSSATPRCGWGSFPRSSRPSCIPRIGRRRCAALLPHRRAVRRRDGAPHRPRARGRRGPRRRREHAWSRRCSRAGRRPCVRQSSSSGSNRPARQPRRSPPAGGRARKARTGCARSSTSGRRAGWPSNAVLRSLLVLCGAIVVCDTMFFAALTPLLPDYADDLDLSKTGAGALQAAYPLGVLVGSIPSGYVGREVRCQADGDRGSARHRRHVCRSSATRTRSSRSTSRASSRASAVRSRGPQRWPG